MKYVLISGTAILRSKIADINNGAWFSFCTTKLAEFDQHDVAHTTVESNGLLMFYFSIPDSEWPMIKIHSSSVATECDICKTLIPYEREYGSPSWPLCEECYGVKPDAKLGFVSATAMKSARLQDMLHWRTI